MPRFAANLSMMFNEWEFLDRFAAARDAGFKAVVALFPLRASAGGRQQGGCGATSLGQKLMFNLPHGAIGARGSAD